MSPAGPRVLPEKAAAPATAAESAHVGRFRKVSSVTVSDLEQLREQEAGCPETTPLGARR